MSYAGPPANRPPPPGWRPPTVVRPAPPRELPAQDHAAVDAAERSAKRVTWAVGAGAGVVLLVVACLLFGRLLS